MDFSQIGSGLGGQITHLGNIIRKMMVGERVHMYHVNTQTNINLLKVDANQRPFPSLAQTSLGHRQTLDSIISLNICCLAQPTEVLVQKIINEYGPCHKTFKGQLAAR